MTINVRPARTAAEEAIAAALEASITAEAGQGRIPEVRRAARDAFLSHGLPSRRVEEWKYTDLRAAVRDFPNPAPAPGAVEEAEAAALVPSLPNAGRILFVNGALSRAGSDFAAQSEGVTA